MRFHMLQNAQMALDFLRYKKIKLVNIRAEDIVDGNPKLTLGLIWTIILHFQVSHSFLFLLSLFQRVPIDLLLSSYYMNTNYAKNALITYLQLIKILMKLNFYSTTACLSVHSGGGRWVFNTALQQHLEIYSETEENVKYFCFLLISGSELTRKFLNSYNYSSPTTMGKEKQNNVRFWSIA